MPNNNWTVRGSRALDLAPFCIMGIVNVTPDSFSDGGEFFSPAAALEQAGELLRGGAAILDLGGESTRPGSAPVSGAEEIDRVVPVMAQLARNRAARKQDFLLSLDTWRAGTAAAGLETGADIINDVTGALFDPALAEVLVQYQPGYILGHCPGRPATMQRAPSYENVVEEVYAWLAGQANWLVRRGLKADRLCLDPCPGFGKNLQHNLALLRDLGRGPGSLLLSLGLPVCVAISRKAMLGQILGQDPGQDPGLTPGSGAGSRGRAEKDAATQALTALLLQSGLCLHRVHDAAGARRAALLQAALI
ncbi:MAG: dihydropteroate synthase [Deltaproteobacteria bacterium]|jgi:dihydropteroate synthase|nr:dihydropteroate synthase [Deltaproteobacteria bacterium]